MARFGRKHQWRLAVVGFRIHGCVIFEKLTHDVQASRLCCEHQGCLAQLAVAVVRFHVCFGTGFQQAIHNSGVAAHHDE
jgi:hypothetical protein